MEESLTGNSVETTGAEVSPTGQEQQNQPAESQNQETISREQSQEAVSDDTAAKQTEQNNGGSSDDDDGLAKFAKSQGFEPEKLTDGERRALKIAHDNQKAYRQANEGKQKITDTTKELGGNSTEARLAQLEYERRTDKFFQEDGRDKSLEPEMVSILNEKVEKLTPELGKEQAKAYAFSLSRDLDTLYNLAELRANGSQSNTEAIRREERESIKRQATASAGQPHAVTQNTGDFKVTREWLETEYQPSNPEHRKMVDEAVQRGDL